MLNFSYIKQDLFASIVVFLVAIPLCLGIALASGVPLISGIIAGIIGGIVVGIFSGSPLSVSGPAAGMIAVITASIHQLGSFEAFLLALCFAGIFQIIAGIIRAGFIANFVPSNVIQGLLVAIGILIIVKQLPLALGYFAEPNSLKIALKETQETLTFSPLLDLLKHLDADAMVISIISLIILIGWGKFYPSLAKRIPAPVVVVLAAIVANQFFHYYFPRLALEPSDLVNIPINETFHDLVARLYHPDFSRWNDINIYLYAFMIAAVASLETLLNLEGVEKLDKKRRYCSRNRELVASGIGNMFSGLVGGIPITSVIVRSSVNIDAGARSKLSAIFHGFLLLLSLTFIAKGLNQIPIAALATILIHTGYKLANISSFKNAYQQGFRYFIPFVITVFAIVVTNLLLGIVIGLSVSLFFILHHNSKKCFTVIQESHPSGDVMRLLLPNQVTFLSKSAIIEELNQQKNNSKIIIDAKFTDYIDDDILGIIKEFGANQATNKNILLNLEGFQEHYDLDNSHSFLNVTTYDIQSMLTPERVLKILCEGNERFVNTTPIHKNYKQQIIATSQSQHPIAVVLGCIDSRVPVEIVFDLSLGDLFVVRIAGNIGNFDILGSIEYACQIVGAKLIIVLGHKDCGAIKAACNNFHGGHIEQLVKKIKPAIDMETVTKTNRTGNNSQFVTNVVYNNIQLTKAYLYRESLILKEMLDARKIGLIGALYDTETGHVEFEDLSTVSLHDPMVPSSLSQHDTQWEISEDKRSFPDSNSTIQ